ncbi:helix-turn-helix domain-containing protein [Parasedimentitalea psychrophila]|uniref:Helix-turn-helix domain-containing protein n=1 Tax=Parasedimentitalea psychrophila TaxID=2997337 RepID=A0A9Y2KXL7_9RHOB|nr:helix-turn-helix domain-containing protein [Parasedimentitalea psychrophila]WIY25010.1 helix-turn-helix domain-containing protein [Parasedimentitalea psychrophila]
MTDPDLPHPKPTAQVEPYFEVLGLDDTLRFIEAFGGTEIYIAKNPRTRSSVAALVGYDKANALTNISHRLQSRVPLAKKWRTCAYKAQGLATVEIARKLGVTDVAVRNWLRAGEVTAPVRRLSITLPPLPLFPDL